MVSRQIPLPLANEANNNNNKKKKKKKKNIDMLSGLKQNT